MFPKITLSLPPFIRQFVLLLAAVASIATGYLINAVALDLEIIFALAVMLVGIASLWLGERGIRLSFLAFVLMFVLGWRRITLAPGFAIHPLVPFIMAIFAFLIVKIVIIERRPIQWTIPLPLWLFSLFWWWGIIIGLLNEAHQPSLWIEFLNFVILLPLFAIAYFVLANPAYWKWSLTTFYAVGVIIAVLGIAESFGLLPGALSTTAVFLTNDGFTRAVFAFFGGPAAVLLSVLGLPMVPLIWSWFPQWYLRVALLGTIPFQLYAIMISGTRAAWVMVVIIFFLLMQMKRGWVGVLLAGTLIIAAVPFLPERVETRFMSLVDFSDSGDFVDTSNQKRADRYQEAVELALEQPLGVGWTNAGWVHSDFLQVVANLGIVPGVLFFGWYVATFFQAWLAVIRNRDRFLLPSLVASFACVGFILLIEGVQVLTQYIVPVWFIWVLVHVRLDQLRNQSADTTVATA